MIVVNKAICLINIFWNKNFYLNFFHRCLNFQSFSNISVKILRTSWFLDYLLDDQKVNVGEEIYVCCYLHSNTIDRKLISAKKALTFYSDFFLELCVIIMIMVWKLYCIDIPSRLQFINSSCDYQFKEHEKQIKHGPKINFSFNYF